jgi:hypothetical protein
MSAFRHAVHYRETLHIYSQLDAAISETPNRTAQQGRDGMKSCETPVSASHCGNPTVNPAAKLRVGEL